MSTKVKTKSALDVINKILAVILAITFVAAIVVVCVAPDKKAAATNNESSATSGDEATIETLKAGTYGGIDFKTDEDVVKYYVEAYNYTKGLTCQYKNEEGKTETWYKFLGSEDLKIDSLLIEGKENAMINKLVPSIVGGVFKAGLYGLPPCANRDPKQDIDEKSNSFQTSRLVKDDVVASNVKDNGDGTITLQIQPKATSMSHRGMDAQGHMFSTLGAIDETVDSISALKWASGTTAENCLVDYAGGYCTVTIDTKTKEITKADYHMGVTVTVNHACVAVIKDKSALVKISYDMHFPCDDQYMMKSKGATRL